MLGQPSSVPGFEVILRSRALASSEATLAGIQKSLGKQVAKGKLDEADAGAILARHAAAEPRSP